MFCPMHMVPTYVSVDEIQEGGKKVLGDPSREKTSDGKLENAVPTGKYFRPIYRCYQRFL
jgi:hypothetical protein